MQSSSFSMTGDSYMKSLNIKLLLLFLCTLVAFIAVSSVTPPFMSPDEPHHYSRAYLLSNGLITLDNKDGMKSGGYIDKSLYESFLTFNNGVVEKVRSSMTNDMAGKYWGDERNYKEIPNTAFYFPAVYIPQAIGIVIGRIFNLSILDTYHLSRIFAFLSCMAIVFYANSVYRIPTLALGLMVMPMMIFQFSAATIDGVTTALSVLMMCLFTKTVRHKETCKKKLIIISIIAFVVVSCRANLIPILLLPFVAAFYSQWKWRMAIPFLAAFFSLTWIAVTISMTKDGGVHHPGITHSQVIAHYIVNPTEVFKVIYNTISNYRLSSFYYKSFVGTLGWLDIWMPHYLYLMYFIAIIALIVLGLSVNKIKRNITLVVSIMIASSCSVLLIFCALLVQYSPFPTDVIIGIQGRYFTIPTIIFAFLLTNDNTKKLVTAYVIVAALSLMSLSSMIPAIINRYYM